MTIIPFPTSVKTADVRVGTESHALANNRVPARPYCVECDGEGRTFGVGTNNPSARPSWAECEKCGGTGVGVEPPCSAACYCWFPLANSPDGSPATGLCVKDECPEPIRSGVGFSAWREWLR